MKRLMIFTVAVVASISMCAGAGAQCVGDLNNDDVTDVQDLLEFLGEWGCTGCAADLNSDGVADISDLLMLLADWGCEGTEPDSTLSGTVINVWTSDPLVGAAVQVGDDVVMTDQFGAYTGEFPVGMYDVVFSAEYFQPQTVPVTLVEGVPMTLDVSMMPVASVVVNVIPEDEGEPGVTVNVLAEVIVLDGSAIQSFQWAQTGGVPAIINGADTDTAALDLGSRGDYKLQLFQVLAEAPIAPEDLPPHIPPPDGEFTGGLQNRFEIASPNFFALEEAGAVHLMVDVMTSSGTYAGEGQVHTKIPWKPAGGIRNLPIDSPVLLHGKTQASYDWVLTRPGNSSATLLDSTTQYPEFTPDVPGMYQVSVTDLAAAAPVSMQIYAGTWRGVIVGQDTDGRPVADSDCTGCHANLGYDKFTPWAQTGHAEIFTNNLNTNTHYSTECFPCHSVGYDLDANNGGFDDAYDYQAFLDSGLINNPGDNWTTMLADFPWSSQLANGQCENCHGPQWGLAGVNTLAHGPVLPMGEPRVDISPTVCAVCHGEPPRHARYQQWQLSAHANYELAIEEGDSGSCSRCHTGNGFLTWLPILLGDAPGDPLANINVTWSSDEVHPQTCATCHDPHANGNTSGTGTNATVRISGDTPPLIAGFTATDVGRGAICMTCHNSRRGLRNDSTFDDLLGTTNLSSSPHGSAQADLLMGENAYLVTVGIRGNHASAAVPDACVNCHMVQTLPPDALSYNQSGTNHTFYAGREICANCHGGGINADTVQANTQLLLDILQASVEQGLLDLIAEQNALGNVIALPSGGGTISDPSEVLAIDFGEYRGQQSMTITLADNMTVGPYRMSDVRVRDGAGVDLGRFYDFAVPDLIKSGWNWGLVHNDGSIGIHNPSFASNVLTTSIDALNP